MLLSASNWMTPFNAVVCCCTQGITGTPVIDPRGNGTIYVGAATTTDSGKTVKCATVV